MELNDAVKMELSDTELSNTDIAEEPSLLPEKSKFKYEKQYQVFSEWCDLNQIKLVSEDVLLKYFNEKSKKFKSSTLWAIYSMLRPTLLEQKDVDIKTFKTLLAYLKQQSVGYKPQKSKILQRSDIYKFLVEAPDKQYLMKKVALIFGLAGACRREELANLSIDDIEDQNTILIIKMQDTRTRATRIFSLKNNGENSPDLLSYYRKYIALRPVNVETRRLFLKYSNGRCSKLVVGINSISKIPRDVASYLGMRDFDTYTGHCFRSSSESFLADAGGDWSSDGRYGRLNASTSVTGDADLTVEYLDSGDSSELSTESPARELNTESLGSNVNTEELQNFIETYKSLPELWNPLNPDYVKKPKRNTALDKLLLIYQKIKPGAIRADVRRKINTLRCNYRKELKKITTSKRSGTGRDTVYQPSSWVFYALQFLDNFEQPVNANIQLDEALQNNNHQSEARIEQHPLPVARSTSRSFTVSPPRPRRQSIKRRSVRITKQNKLLPKACDYLPKSNEEKNIPTIAIAWGETLTTLGSQQRIFAEKAINDILFEARQGNLSRYSVKINQDACEVPLPTRLSKTVPTSHQSHIFEDNSPEPYSEEEEETPGTVSALFTNFNPN